jgi:hypothetical protein
VRFLFVFACVRSFVKMSTAGKKAVHATTLDKIREQAASDAIAFLRRDNKKLRHTVYELRKQIDALGEIMRNGNDECHVHCVTCCCTSMDLYEVPSAEESQVEPERTTTPLVECQQTQM